MDVTEWMQWKYAEGGKEARRRGGEEARRGDGYERGREAWSIKVIFFQVEVNLT